MKVAIIGAGLSGLACAFELERLGIRPVIFEKKAYIGKEYMYASTTLRILDRTIRSSYSYLNHKYSLDLKPFLPIRKITMHGPNKKSVVRGNLGYIFMRGEEKDSLENQLARWIKSCIVFDTYVDIEDIKKDFDYIVAATGDESVAKKLGVWTTTLNVFTRVALVLGKFEPDSTIMWMNREYSKSCYAYLSAHGLKDARILLSVDNITGNEIDFYWEQFVRKEKIEYKIKEIKDIESSLGYVTQPVVENVYLVGNGAGLIDDFLGFGAISAVESGILAARSIAGNLDYIKLIEPVRNYVNTLREYRKVLNEFDNREFDRLISFLGFPVINKLLYNNPFINGNCFAFAAKAYNKSRDNSR